MEFLSACKEDNTAIVEIQFPYIDQETKKNGLIDAITSKSLNVITFLVKKEVEKYSDHIWDYIPIFNYISELVLRQGFYQSSLYKNSPLYIALRMCDIDIAKIFIKYKYTKKWIIHTILKDTSIDDYFREKVTKHMNEIEKIKTTLLCIWSLTDSSFSTLPKDILEIILEMCYL